MLTSEQIRAARALLRWDQAQVASASGVSLPTVKRLEKLVGPISANTTTEAALRRAFDAAGVILIDENGKARASASARIARVGDPGFIRRLPIGPFASRPRLVGGIIFGAAVAIALTVVPNDLRPSTRTVLSWDGGCLWFVVGTISMMMGATGDAIRSRAADQDEGQHFILGLVLVAAAVALGVIGVELSLAKSAHGLEKTLRVAAAFSTVAISWFVVQLVFALHYAHEYYSAKDGAPDQIAGGMAFPNDDCPDYWDFLYFSLIIGVASQTADVSFTEKTTRRIGSVHGVIAFTFNTVVLALTINLLAGLF